MMSVRNTLAATGMLVLMIHIFSSCTTIPEATKEEKELQGVKFGSIREILAAIHLGTLKPYEVKLTREKGLDLDEHFHFGKMFTDRLLFRSADLGEENEGYLREENPSLIFPLADDPVEADTFRTYVNVWKFNGQKGKKVDVILRSISTFPSGMFLPYVLLLDSTGMALARQEQVVCIPKEMTKPESIIVWFDNLQLQLNQTYYVLAFADMKNSGVAQQKIRLGDNRYPVKTVYMNQWGWKFENETLPFSGGSPVGAYELVIKLY